MKKFVFVLYGAVRSEDIKPEDMKATMDRWMTWFGTFKENIIDNGNPFASIAKSVTAKGTETIPADKWPAKGYIIVNAKDIDEAVNIAKVCPALVDDPEGAVRVYEAMPM
ncbi:MAG: hypothetical protein AAB388_04475 [Patescibacteria group bacterium]